MKPTFLLSFVAVLLLLPGCDPIRVTNLRAPACEDNRTRFSITDVVTEKMVDRIHQIVLSEGLEETSLQKTESRHGPFFEGSYEVCGLVSCSRKRVTVEISSKAEKGQLDVRIVDWFSFEQSQYAKTLSARILHEIDAEFGVDSIGMVKNGCA
jgi:hypothetical protein